MEEMIYSSALSDNNDSVQARTVSSSGLVRTEPSQAREVRTKSVQATIAAAQIIVVGKYEYPNRGPLIDGWHCSSGTIEFWPRGIPMGRGHSLGYQW